MTDSVPTATFSTTGELAEHLADRARGAVDVGASRSLLDILSPLFQRTEEIARSLRAGDGRFAGNTAHDDLRSLLERCERDAGQAGKSDTGIEDAVLATVVWIDEAISAALSTATPDAEADDPEDPFGDPEASETGRQELYRLQTSRFEISDGGVRFFERLSQLASEQTEVREVYVAVLQLGFRGQYFAEDDRRQLDGIKREHAGLLLTVTQRPVVAPPEPKSPARDDAAPGQLRRRWKTVAAAAAAVVLIGAALLYGDCWLTYGTDCAYCTFKSKYCFH